MQKQSTKERIMTNALSLFAEYGYEAVSVAQIAEAVGIKPPSLYKHYKSKQDVFNAILDEMVQRYKIQASGMKMDGINPNMDTEIFTNISSTALITMGKELFSYFLHDEYVSKFRKMLTIEQYHSPALAHLYTQQYFDDPLSYEGMLFGLLMGQDVFIQANSQIMALHFYAPIYLLLTLCDRHPDREDEAISILEKHIKQFSQIYTKENLS